MKLQEIERDFEKCIMDKTDVFIEIMLYIFFFFFFLTIFAVKARERTVHQYLALRRLVLRFVKVASPLY